MITNILLGLILITLIIIICGRQEKHTITMFIQENEKAFVPNTIEVIDLRDSVSKLPDCKDETSKQVKPNQVEEEQICMTAGLPTHEDCPITYVREQVKPKRKVNKEYERKIADGFFEDLVIKILKEKREKMCSTVDILKRHRTTMNTFKRHATKEQIAELMALQVETKKQSVDKQRQNIYHKRS